AGVHGQTRDGRMLRGHFFPAGGGFAGVTVVLGGSTGGGATGLLVEIVDGSSRSVGSGSSHTKRPSSPNVTRNTLRRPAPITPPRSTSSAGIDSVMLGANW